MQYADGWCVSHIYGRRLKGLSALAVRLCFQRKSRLLKYKIFRAANDTRMCSMWKVRFHGLLLLLHTSRRTNDAFLFDAVSLKILDAFLTFVRRIERLKMGTYL
jgi:hypothetical protein